MVGKVYHVEPERPSVAQWGNSMGEECNYGGT